MCSSMHHDMRTHRAAVARQTAHMYVHVCSMQLQRSSIEAQHAYAAEQHAIAIAAQLQHHSSCSASGTARAQPRMRSS